MHVNRRKIRRKIEGEEREGSREEKGKYCGMNWSKLCTYRNVTMNPTTMYNHNTLIKTKKLKNI